MITKHENGDVTVGAKEFERFQELCNNKEIHTTNVLPKLGENESYVKVEHKPVKRTAKVRVPPYMQILGGRFMPKRNESLIQLICQMTKPEQWFFALLEERFDTNNNNIAYISGKEIALKDKPKLSQAYKALRAKNLVKRVKREHYMISPHYILNLGEYESHVRLWDSLK